jgi:sterol 24-C-methyltransferase
MTITQTFLLQQYIPPQIDARVGLYENQLLHEKEVFAQLDQPNIQPMGPGSRVLDIGCGRGRIAHYFATLRGSSVSGFNIDSNQIENAKEYAKITKMDQFLDFKVGDHHKRFQYEDETFHGAYSFQAVWPFFKIHELDFTAREIYRVLKPGGVYSCGEYLLTPEFKWDNKKHLELHKLFLPTLAATQSMYPADVTAAFERAGFNVLVSAPSVAPAWPLTDQKTDLFLLFRSFVISLTRIGLCPTWVETLINNLLLGGQAWAEAEKMKIADLNWQITVQKPLKL